MVTTRSGAAALSAMVLFSSNNTESEELQGQLVRVKRRCVRHLSETWEEMWLREGNSPIEVAVKYIRYPRVLAQDPALSLNEKIETSQRIRREIQTWIGLEHENIRPLLGYKWGEEPRVVFMWSKNGNIKSYCHDKPFSVKTELLTEAATGLMFLHQQTPEIVHGALNASNIIVNDSGKAMLCDFGMASDMQQAQFGMTISESESYAAVAYTSPDLLLTGEFTKATDIYAFGSLIVEILSGHPPFYGVKHMVMLQSIMDGKTASIEDHDILPADSPYWSIVHQCWQTNADDRPSAEDLRRLLLDADSQGRLSSLYGAFCNFLFGLSGIR